MRMTMAVRLVLVGLAHSDDVHAAPPFSGSGSVASVGRDARAIRASLLALSAAVALASSTPDGRSAFALRRLPFFGFGGSGLSNVARILLARSPTSTQRRSASTIQSAFSAPPNAPSC